MTPPPLFAFYHIWADGEWEEPVEDFVRSVRDSGLDGELTGKFLGLVGTEENCIRVLSAMPGGWLPVATAQEGFTQVTLAALRTFALCPGCSPDGLVFYGHNKGALNNTEINRRWRRSMYRHVFENWRVNVELLADYDAVGCHWLTQEEFPQMSFRADLPAPRHFGGEVWAARLDYVRRLPPLRYDTRWDSEPWIGYCDGMRPYDLLPGWPAFELFDRPVLELPRPGCLQVPAAAV